MGKGHSQLVQKIQSEISKTGPLTFARFMEYALYDADFGYYMNNASPSKGERQPSGSRIGWGGDFLTTPYLYPILAKALARQTIEIDQLLESPEELVVVEMGAGDGLLARDFLVECAQAKPDLFARLKYILIDRSPAMRASQRDHVQGVIKQGAQISWVSSLSELESNSMIGVLLSNELLDAMPVHRVRVEGRELKEIHVDAQDGNLVETTLNPSTPDLLKFLTDLGVELPEGFTTEVNLEALEWVKNVARVLKRGVVITIDYGHTAHDFFSPSRKDGTLLCYSGHSVNESPLKEVGFQDMTAHVNFSSVAVQGEREGLQISGFTDLMHFLMSSGVEQMVEGLDANSEAVQAAAQLLRPDGMGRTFKILIQHMGMETPTLSGLHYRPFFEGALVRNPVAGSC